MAKQEPKKEKLTILPANLRVLEVEIEGDAPYVQAKFPEKVKKQLIEKQKAGPKAKNRSTRAAKDFEAAFIGALHHSREGWVGLPATAFRSAMIDACRVAGYHMTKAKMSVVVLADDYDPEDRTPLIKFTKGEPEQFESVVSIQKTIDIAVRGYWPPGWRSKLRIRYDADQFEPQDVINLLMRAGLQVGVGCGRPFSKNSNGMGWGTFHIPEQEVKDYPLIVPGFDNKLRIKEG